MQSQSMTAEAGRDMRPAEVKVWDPLVRLFHWSLVLSIAVAWATGEDLRWLHLGAGYAVAGLIAIRMIWGLVGTRHARFTDFIYHPTTVLAFLKDTAQLRARRYLGHNPAGGAMVIAMLVILVAISVTGVMMTTNAFWGVEWVGEAHEATVNLALVLVLLHLVGIAIASLEHGENLVRSMLTGRKRAD